VLDRALAKKSEDRYASGGEFAHALQAVLSGLAAVPPYPNGQAARPPAMGMPAPQPEAASGAMKAAGGGGQNAPMQPMPPSSALPLAASPNKAPSVGLLVGVAVAFLVVGAGLAALFMRLFVK
jgi:hypothetical protein